MFRNLLGKLGKILYLKYGKPDIVAMTREQLGVFNKPFNISEAGKQKEEIFYYEVETLSKNSALNNIFDEVVEGIKDDIFYKTDDKMIIYDRFSINGISLIKEKIIDYANLAPKVGVEFDKYAIT